jgi:hypothetical protein
MEKVVTRTVDALQKFGERIERRLSTGGDDDDQGLDRSGSGFMFPSSGSAFRRPLDKKQGKNNYYSSKQRDAVYGGGGRNSSSDNLAASPAGRNSYSNYRQNPVNNRNADGMGRPPYGTGIGGPIN